MKHLKYIRLQYWHKYYLIKNDSLFWLISLIHLALLIYVVLFHYIAISLNVFLSACLMGCAIVCLTFSPKVLHHIIFSCDQLIIKMNFLESVSLTMH